MENRGRFQKYAASIGTAAAVLVIAAVYILRTDRAVGLFKDDAWYLLLGKALADGQGYRLVNYPVPPGLPLYPPGLPLVFAAGIRLCGLTTDTFWWLKLVSIAAMLALGWLTYRHAREVRGESGPFAGLLAAATVLCPTLVFLATSTLMAECLFAALQMAAVLLTERAVAADRPRRAGRLMFAASGVGAFAWLVRSAGIALLAAIPLYLILRKKPKLLIPFALGCLVVVGPWQLYAARQQAAADPSEQITSQYGSVFWHRIAQPSAPPVGVRDLPGRAWQNTTLVAGNVIGGLTAPIFYRPASDSGTEALGMTGIVGFGEKFPLSPDFMGFGAGAIGTRPGEVAFSLVLTAFFLIGFLASLGRGWTLAELFVPLSLAVTLLWPWWPLRFVVPLLPFIFYYMAIGWLTVGEVLFRGRLAERGPRLLAGSFLTAVAVLALADHIGYLRAARTGRSEWVRRYEAVRTAARWAATQLPADEVVGTDNIALTNLLAGRKTHGDYTARYYLKTSYGTDLPEGAKTLFSAPEFPGVTVSELPTPK
jgi:hypothetical protein